LPLKHVPDLLAGYLRTRLERDVRLLGEVTDWHQFGRFVRLMAALTAQEIVDQRIAERQSKSFLKLARSNHSGKSGNIVLARSKLVPGPAASPKRAEPRVGRPAVARPLVARRAAPRFR
jgi:hypothetical protein